MRRPARRPGACEIGPPVDRRRPRGERVAHRRTVRGGILRVPTTPFGRALRSLRPALGLSTSGLSRVSGMDIAQIARLDSGERRPALGRLIALAALKLGHDERVRLVDAAGLPIKEDQ